MKTAAINKMDYPYAPYPNAATRREVFHKVVDFLVMLASGAGVGAILLFMLANA